MLRTAGKKVWVLKCRGNYIIKYNCKTVSGYLTNDTHTHLKSYGRRGGEEAGLGEAQPWRPTDSLGGPHRS